MDNPQTPQTEPTQQGDAPRTFTQADIDRIVEARLADEGKRGRGEGREEGKRQIESKLGVSIEEALEIIYKAKNPNATPPAKPSQDTTEAPAWAKGILSKVEQLEQQLAQSTIEKKRLEVHSKASQAGVFPELIDLIDANTEDIDAAIQKLLDKQKAIVEKSAAPRKPAPPTLHAGATSQPKTSAPELDITSREEALKIKRGGGSR